MKLKLSIFLLGSLIMSCSSTNNMDSNPIVKNPDSPRIGAGSRIYEPQSEWEQAVYDESTFDVWPDDVRDSIETFKDTSVAWAGVVEKYFIDEQEEYIVLNFYAKHHYYDWIEDFGPENKPIKLSPSGEGYFLSYFLFKKGTDMDEMTAGLIGDCIISYGKPAHIEEDGTIQLESDYVRLIPKNFVSIWFNYGREGFGGAILK
ncbi:hypothetical protein [Spirochaeta cellobiosiphila]|uniref:hypothetical protein n=1 Tax=Spirochaeta cellobiosiphila TaxID=504483 RepID=UPI0004210D4D|nr:hypothetical protein [Spirochaeta cellobiosiphila]